MVWIVLLLAAFWAGPGGAVCIGRDLIAALPADARAAFEARLTAVPHAEGLLWRAERAGAVLHLVGTYHLDDPRHDALMAEIAPLLRGARRVLVEAGPEEQAAALRAIAAEPGLLFAPEGPTLAERLDEDEWQALRRAMAARGVPAPLAARMRPWAVAVQLGVPPCLAAAAADRGLDARIVAAAKAAGVPVAALEPHDTLFALVATLGAGDETGLLRSALALEPQAEDMAVTLAGAYFARRPWAIWLLARDMALASPGADPAAVEAMLRLTQGALMAGRNRAWVPVMTAAAAGGPVLAAFGALHLPGADGVLALLAAEGFAVTRLD